MKTQTLFVSVFAVVLLQACTSSTEPVAGNCPDALIEAGSVRVTVLDSASGAPIGNAVTATAIDGRFFDAVTTPDRPEYAARPIPIVSPRVGTYDVYVSKNGYRPWATYNVVVKSASCGVYAANITARLQLSSSPN